MRTPIAPILILLCLGLIAYKQVLDYRALSEPAVDSYLCVQSERNRAPDPRCPSSTKELP